VFLGCNQIFVQQKQEAREAEVKEVKAEYNYKPD
jgi:hypothetical protein